MEPKTKKKIMAASVYVYGVKKRCRKSERHSFRLAETAFESFDLEAAKRNAVTAIREGMKQLDQRTNVVLHVNPEEIEDCGTYTMRSFMIGQGKSYNITELFPELPLASKAVSS